MAKIMYFKNKVEFDFYFRNRASRKIGVGSEGTCYVGNFDDLVYKKFDTFLVDMNYDIKKIITTEDIQLDSFAFPDTLFVCGDRLLGYTSRFVYPDYFSFKRIRDINNLFQLDFNRLRSAYAMMQNDLERLSQEHIYIYDLPHNLLFDGTHFVGVDTCSYERVSRKVYRENIESVDVALKTLFDSWIRGDERFALDSDLEIDRYMLTLERTVRKLKKH